MRDLAIDSELPQTIENFDPARLCSKVGNYSWIGSVQGAVATWSVISIRDFLAILDWFEDPFNLDFEGLR
jgi:hypothetical protein